MKFCEMLKPLQEGRKIRRSIWAGWWQKTEGGVEIINHTHDGRTINLRDHDMMWLIENICAEDWEVVGDICDNSPTVFPNELFNAICNIFLENGGMLNADMARTMKNIANNLSEDYKICYKM